MVEKRTKRYWADGFCCTEQWKENGTCLYHFDAVAKKKEAKLDAIQSCCETFTSKRL